MGKTEKRYIELKARETGEGFTGTLLNFSDIADKGSYRERAESQGISLKDRLMLNYMHERSQPIARVGTEFLQIERSDKSIDVVLNKWPETNVARESKAQWEAGNLTGLSMEIVVDEASWDGDNLRTIKSGQIVGMAMVDEPAYPMSEINRAWDGYEQETPPLDPKVWL